MGSLPARVAWNTLRGRRSANQDCALVHELGTDRMLVAVADGMGGRQAGDEASRRALYTLRDAVEAGSDLAAGVRAANAAVYEQGTRNVEHAGMGTTLVAVLADSSRYVVANVGDSRAYRIDAEGIRQITVDHSFAAEALANGTLSEDELEDSPWRNALTRAIGTDPEVSVDLFGPFSTDPPHRVLLCTDGLYRAMPDSRILEVVRNSADLEATSERVSNLAYDAGATDNITVALLAIGRDPVGSDSSRKKVIVRAPTGPRLSHKRKVELGVAGVTLLLALVAAFAILSVL